MAEALKLRQDVFLAEIQLESFYAGYVAARAARRYQPISRFPAVERDFSLIMAEGVSFEQIAAEIRRLSIAEITNIEAVDLFREGQIPRGQFSLLVRVTFQSQEATLTESQLSDFGGRIAEALHVGLGASLRSV